MRNWGAAVWLTIALFSAIAAWLFTFGGLQLGFN